MCTKGICRCTFLECHPNLVRGLQGSTQEQLLGRDVVHVIYCKGGHEPAEGMDSGMDPARLGSTRLGGVSGPGYSSRKVKSLI